MSYWKWSRRFSILNDSLSDFAPHIYCIYIEWPLWESLNMRAIFALPISKLEVADISPQVPLKYQSEWKNYATTLEQF
jgi:hypothetical protein